MEKASIQFQQLSEHAKQPYLGNSIYKAIGGESWLNFKGTFSLEKLYKLTYETLKKLGYKDLDGTNDKIESYYFEKAGEEGSKSEVWYWWRTEKTNNTMNLFTFRFEMDVQVLNLKKTTITIDGNKYGTNYGEISIFIRPYMKTVYEEQNWAKKKGIQGFLMRWWAKRAYKSTFEERKKEAYSDVNTIYALIKDYLGLENFVSPQYDFHPKKGEPMVKL